MSTKKPLIGISTNELTNFNDASNFYLEMLGNFISIDFRYFFAE